MADNVKAAFIYNFTQFVEWPETAFVNAENPLIIGIIGEDNLESFIDETVAGKQAKGRPVTVRLYRDLNEITNCYILYIGNSAKARLKEIMAAFTGKSVLTVSDLEDFTTSGGIVRFINRENKIKLQINLPASKAAALNVSSKLLEVAGIVN